jgi:ATP-dependent DNA ligase
VLRAAREHGLEGIVSKKRGSPYRSDRVKSWVKAVCTVRDSFAVIAEQFLCGLLKDLMIGLGQFGTYSASLVDVSF